MQGQIADPHVANAGIQHKLVDREFEIKYWELQLQRAHAQREILQKQLKDTPDGSTSFNTYQRGAGTNGSHDGTAQIDSQDRGSPERACDQSRRAAWMQPIWVGGASQPPASCRCRAFCHAPLPRRSLPKLLHA